MTSGTGTPGAQQTQSEIDDLRARLTTAETEAKQLAEYNAKADADCRAAEARGKRAEHRTMLWEVAAGMYADAHSDHDASDGCAACRAYERARAALACPPQQPQKAGE